MHISQIGRLTFYNCAIFIRNSCLFKYYYDHYLIMGKRNSKLPPSDLAELAEITDFDEQEIKLWFKSFRKDCPSGKLNFSEFQKLYNKFFPAGDASAFAKYTFRTFDQNGDGSIDFREFMCALSVTSRGNFEEKLRWAFSMYDLDGDGLVSRKEISELVTAIYRMVGDDTRNALIKEGITPEQRVDEIFTKMDKDGDATITETEFKFAALADPTLVMILQNAGC